jgi:hypothetical protein
MAKVNRSMGPETMQGVQHLGTRGKFKPMRRVRNAMARANTAKGQRDCQHFIENQLGSGPIKTLSSEEIAELENQYTMKSE